MKNKLIIFIFLLMMFASCQNKNSPEYVTEQYVTALKNKDYEKAKLYAHPALDQILDFYKDQEPDFGITEVKDVRCRVDGEAAICTYCCSTDTFFFTTVKLRKTDGKWLVMPNKESPPPTDSIE